MTPQQQNLAIPVAIVIAGALIAAALYFGGMGAGAGNQNIGIIKEAKAVPEVTASDHIRGNTDAEVTIVEYTDLECPFCKQFHGTMEQVMEKYGPDGKVAWVIRNFPLAQLHPNAPALALAAECVAELGGNDAYWNFLTGIFTEAPLNTPFDFSKMDSVVASVNVAKPAFSACVDSEKYREKIEQEFNDAVASGGSGTPYNVIVLLKPISRTGKDTVTRIETEFQSQGAPAGTLTLSKDGKYIGMSGSLPLEIVTEIVDSLLK